jgi:hypothetical protein
VKIARLVIGALSGEAGRQNKPDLLLDETMSCLSGTLP